MDDGWRQHWWAQQRQRDGANAAEKHTLTRLCSSEGGLLKTLSATLAPRSRAAPGEGEREMMGERRSKGSSARECPESQSCSEAARNMNK